MSSADDGRAPALQAFLSHRYEAPGVNLYFHELTSEIATVTFRVDSGKVPWRAAHAPAPRRRTSTTRLERMIRDADVFVGVWPLPGETTAPWRAADLAEESRYFRLELDIAARAGKRGIVFADRRYRNVLEPPAGIVQVRYGAQEVPYGRTAPAWRTLQDGFRSFCTADRPLDRGNLAHEEGRVGLLVEPHADVDVSALAEELLADRTLTPVRLPTSMSLEFLREARRCDWVVVDLSHPAVEILATFLHGQAVPLLRLRRSTDGAPAALDDVLFGDLPVGYRRDVVRWSDADELTAGLGERLRVVTEEPEYIGDRATAERYFVSAAQRPEPVFLSYAGEDDERGAEFSAALGRRFSTVFDYRDRQRRSLPVGKPWMDELYAQLGSAAIGVILHSAHYRASGYCRDEQRLLYDAKVGGRAELLVVKVDGAPVPEPLSTLQYANIRGRDAASVVAEFVDTLDPPSVPDRTGS